MISHIFEPKIYEQIPEPDKIALEIIDHTAKSLEKKYNIHFCGIGMREKFEYIAIDFEVFRPLEKNEAREMLHVCVEEFLKNINSNKKIQPYLKTKPFGYNNVGIMFYIRDSSGQKIYHPRICTAEWNSWGVTFRTKDPEKQYRYKEHTNETHKEAIALVKK